LENEGGRNQTKLRLWQFHHLE